MNSRILWLIPAATYALSYVYLAVFHGQWWLWNTVIHEGGTLTLFDTTVYASHFLGHVPSLTLVGFVFATWYAAFSELRIGRPHLRWSGLALLLLISCLVYSLWRFGAAETWDFILQRKQSVTRYEAGGSFLLHLPSTLSLFVLVPIMILTLKAAFGKRVGWQPQYLDNLSTVFVVTLLFAMLVGGCACAVTEALTDPRYLAHSVRELATFPLTFFPLPLAVWLAHDAAARDAWPQIARRVLLATVLLSLPILVYQAIIPLRIGIEELAQRPTFSSESLPISYLLASHFFEHVLDSVYFTLVCFALIPPQKMLSQESTAS